MYLHIGSGKNIIKKNIIGVFDMDTATVSSVTRSFMRKKERAGETVYEESDIPRSFIVEKKEIKNDKKGSERRYDKRNDKRHADAIVYLSKISTAALKVRLASETYYDYDMTEEN